jgi:hypothetical protein
MSETMHMTLGLLTFFVSLPLSVWFLANLLAVLDQRPITKPLVRLLLTSTLIALFLTVTHKSLWLPIALALCLVTFSHAIAGFAFRKFGLGIKVFKKDPSQ